MAFSPNSKRLVTSSDGQQALRLWDTDGWQDVLTLEGEGANFNRTAFSKDGNVIGSLTRNGTLQLWWAPSWEEIEAAVTQDPPPPG